MGDQKLYADEAAELAGVKPATWRRYCSTAGGRRRVVPPADGIDTDRGHARPWWWQSTIEKWKNSRPGTGARTDLKENLDV